MRYKKIKIIFFILLLFAFVLPIAQQVSALDSGINEVNQTVDLGNSDPRQTVGRIINFAMLFLAIIAVGIVIFAGFKWMTAGGSEDKIADARKLLLNGIIGLAIVLAAWGITAFVLNKLIGATGNGTGSETCIDGSVVACGCGGTRVCTTGSWGSCVGSNCGGGSTESCDFNALLAGCQQDNSICATNYFCNTECQCETAGGLGDPCDADGLGNDGVCSSPDDNHCGEYLQCNPDSCTCEGSPVITAITPYGGFCETDVNLPCNNDNDCSSVGSACDLSSPNGANKNIISIHGHNFDTTGAIVTFLGDPNNSGDDVIALSPSDVNGNCSNTNTETLIITVIPPGAVTGPIMVTNTDDTADTTDNEVGPVINDFVNNNIVRPGLCLLSPTNGMLTEEVEYQGINLSGASAYFGNYNNNFKGLNENFNNPSGLDGTTQVPNINQGDTSSFVTATIASFDQRSNYLNFTKDSEPDTGPYITSISPTQGAPGQYVTISGSGFGNTRGFNQVLFGDEEAAYDFPNICQNSVWSDNQVIVKVPNSASNGSYLINMKIGDWEIDSSQADPNSFTINDNLDLLPSLCKMSPVLGPRNSPVELWGEYFGSTGSNSVARFFYNQDKTAQVQADEDAQKLSTAIPQLATSGPVKVVNGGQEGNSLNFTIGECQADDDCGLQICCPLGTYEAGRCEDPAPGNNVYGNCYVDIPSSVYESNFSTNWSNNTTIDYYSCAGMAQALGSCQENEFCPNLPGQCSPYPGGGSQIIGQCDYSCNNIPGCSGNACSYDANLDECVLTAQTCSPQDLLEYTLGSQNFTAIKTCNQDGNFQIEVETSCPTDWTNLGNGICVDENSSCDLCPNDFSCFNTTTNGICVSDQVCGNGAVCQSNNNCVITDNATCSCCCEIGQDDRDCCAGLTCGGTCGSDSTDDGAGLGLCGGCADAGTTQAEHDAACNCTGHEGQYCEINDENPAGVCVDCSGLMTPTECQEHSDVCCIDFMNNNACRAGDGTTVHRLPGYCGYYRCALFGNCGVNPWIMGDYSDFATCQEECDNSSNPSVCENLSPAQCLSGSNSCCLDAKNGNVCRDGDSINNGTVQDGYCAYYDCSTIVPSECNIFSPTTTGQYESTEECVVGCAVGPPGGWGASCGSEQTGVCDTFVCSNPFACIAENGGPPSSSDCGFCCCDPSRTGPDDVCTSINENLSCLPNQTPCGGENRGLCCGCSADDECGGDAVGCGVDTCCRARPNILTDKTVPSHLQVNVCRNVLISAPFDQKMNGSSFANNVLLLEEHDYGNGTCPAGTFLTDIRLNVPQRASWFTRTISAVWDTINFWSAKNSIANKPDPDKLYCQVPGDIASEQNANETTSLVFKPSKLLDASTNYYVVVKGDVELNSSQGVLSLWQIGLDGQGYWDIDAGNYIEGNSINFNGKNYANSYIWKFTTLDDQGSNAGVCEVNYVTVSPDSYLFQTTQNDISENDNDPSDPTYDTVKDRDKVYTAKAFSIEGQRLNRIAGYDWNWQWDIDNSNIVNFSGVSSLPLTTYDDKQMVLARADIQDGQTYVQAKVDMAGFNNMTTAGDGVSQSTPVYVFVCQNPWPPVDPVTYTWSPWLDTSNNCDTSLPGINCDNYNYNFYYCRDDGQSGTFDDLPAILNNNAVIRGSSKVCSNGGGLCTNDSDCGSGVCIWNVLKESYFFRQPVPSLGEISEVIDLTTGGSLKVLWHSNSYLVDHYKIYYRSDQASQDQSVVINPDSAFNPDDPSSTRACLPENPVVGQDYNCQFVINSLENNTPYIIKMTAVSSNGSESPLSNEVTGTPTDAQAPMQPAGLGSGQ